MSFRLKMLQDCYSPVTVPAKFGVMSQLFAVAALGFDSKRIVVAREYRIGSWIGSGGSRYGTDRRGLPERKKALAMPKLMVQGEAKVQSGRQVIKVRFTSGSGPA
jgi:hypothetical protein